MILAIFGSDSLTFTLEKEHKTVSILYRDHPEIFGHPRFLMASPDKGEALVRDSLRQLVSRWGIPPKVAIRVERDMAGGVTEIDRRILSEIFMHAGARDVIHQNA